MKYYTGKELYNIIMEIPEVLLEVKFQKKNYYGEEFYNNILFSNKPGIYNTDDFYYLKHQIDIGNRLHYDPESDDIYINDDGIRINTHHSKRGYIHTS